MTQAIFLSYASQDADFARRIREALRAAGLEVWFDQSELRGGDAWDASIRKQIKECALFVPIISANTDARPEGYFRLEWKLAVDRSHLMADDQPFFVPVILGDIAEPSARVPEKFRERQWTRLNDDSAVRGFAERIAKVQAGSAPSGKSASNSPSNGEVRNSSEMLKSVAPMQIGAQVSSSDRALNSERGAETDLGPDLHRDDKLGSAARHERASSTQPKPSRRTAIIAAALVPIIVAALALNHLRTTSTVNTTSEINSIAVLPFQTPQTPQSPTNTTDADTDYLSVGLAETLIYQLSRLPILKVSPASSVYRYKGKEIDPLKVGAELGVAAVMTGRLVQRGESLSISVELVDVRHNKSLWGEKYDRKMADLLATQRDIASEITRALQLNLSGESKQQFAKRFTDNSEAYQLYLKGQYLYAKRGKDNLLRSIDFYQQAVKLDPNFAKAHVAIADAYSIAAFNNDLAAKEALPLAAAAAERALTIDPTLAEAHAAKASVSAMDWRWEEAERGFARAIELNPDVAETRFRHALLVMIPTKKTEEAIVEMRRATALEPQSIVMGAVLTRAYLAAGKTQLALEHARKVHALDPDHVAAFNWLVIAGMAAESYTEVLEVIAKRRSNTNDPAVQAGYASIAYAKIGKLEEAKREARALESGGGRPYYFAMGVGTALAGNREKAFELLERAYAAKEPGLAYLSTDPFAISLRGDQRYVDLIKRMGLPP